MDELGAHGAGMEDCFDGRLLGGTGDTFKGDLKRRKEFGFILIKDRDLNNAYGVLSRDLISSWLDALSPLFA